MRRQIDQNQNLNPQKHTSQENEAQSKTVVLGVGEWVRSKEARRHRRGIQRDTTVFICDLRYRRVFMCGMYRKVFKTTKVK